MLFIYLFISFCSDTRVCTVQADAGFSSAIIPEESYTQINTRGAYNPSRDAWFELFINEPYL